MTLRLKTTDPVYEKAMRAATAELAQLRAAITGVGFAEDDLKTANFDIDTAYESACDRDGNYRRHFVGYRVTHELKLSLHTIRSACPGRSARSRRASPNRS